MNRASPQIDCPIDLFGPIEQEVAEITADLNRAANAADKGRLAGDLRNRLAVLLDCESFDRNNTNCRLCREFSTLRDKTAAVVQQAARLV